MRILGSLAFAICVAACRKPAPAPPPAQEWKFLRFVDAPDYQTPIVTSNGTAALVLKNGKLGPAFKLAESSGLAAVGRNKTVLVGEAHSVRALDTETGVVRWTHELSNAYGGAVTIAIGSRTAAVAHANGFEILDLDKGTALSAIANQRAISLFFNTTGVYVVQLRGELRLVDETGAIRFQQPISDADHSRLMPQSKTSLLILADDTYRYLDVAQSKITDEGTLTKCDHERGDADADVIPLGHNGRGGSYDVVDKGHGSKGTVVVACDPVGKERWRVSWPVIRPTVNTSVLEGDGGSVGFFVSGLAETDPIGLVAFDDTSGNLLFKQSLALGTRTNGASGSCWIFTTTTIVTCLDARTGAAVWQTPHRSRHPDVRPIAGGDVLLMDGGALSRFGVSGQKWRLSLSGSDSFDQWSFASDVGVHDEQGHLSVLNLATGALQEVHP